MLKKALLNVLNGMLTPMLVIAVCLMFAFFATVLFDEVFGLNGDQEFVFYILVLFAVSIYSRVNIGGLLDAGNTGDSSPKKEVEKNIIKKCNQIRATNIVILFLIAASAAAGMYIFVNAEGLAKGSNAYEEAYERINVLSHDVKENKAAIENNYSALKEMAEQQQQVAQSEAISSYDERFADINRRMDYINAINKEFQTSKDSIIKSLKDAEAAVAGPLVFISTISNKIGSILILYFFIQILVTIYRYNAKALMEYDTKLIMISMASDADKMTAEEISKLFDLTKVDFESRDKAPISEMMELLKTVAAATKTVNTQTNQAGSQKPQNTQSAQNQGSQAQVQVQQQAQNNRPKRRRRRKNKADQSPAA